MNNQSIWQTVEFEPQPPLKGDTQSDYTIVGAGLCGLMCAFELTERGIDGRNITVIDAERICSGATARTTAKVTVQHGLIYDRLIRHYGAEQARQYARLNSRALDRLRQIVSDYDIDCDLQECRSLVYATKPESVSRITAEADAAGQLGISNTLTEDTELPFKVQLALVFDRQAKFHPLKFAHAIYRILLERGCRFYEKTTATSIRGGSVITAAGQIRSKKIIVSSHFPFADMRGLHFAKLYQRRSFVLAVENAAVIRDNYYGCDSNPVSFRGYGDTLLIGGESHKCGDGRDFSNLYDLIERACELYPECLVMSRWANQDIMSYTHLPLIGPINRFDENVLLATAFNRWGMSTSLAAAQIIADIIVRGSKVPSIVSSLRQMNTRSAIGLTRQLGEIAADFATDFSSPRCSHMGCPLTYNAAEGTWDCHCHGSRFKKSGEVINGPAKHPIEPNK